MTQKIGIIGYKGFVGSALFELFSSDKSYEVVGIGREEYESLKGKSFDILINANGNSSKVLAEREPKKDFEMNVVSTFNSLMDLKCGKYVYISSVDVYPDKSARSATGEDSQIRIEKLSNYGLGKYLAEQVVRKHAKQWLILRLGGMVGKNMKKGPMYDILNLRKLFLSSKSRFQFISTADVAQASKTLIERGKWGEIYNVVGEGNLELGEIAALAGVKLESEGKDVHVLDVSCAKLKKEFPVKTTKETVLAFLNK